MLSSGYLNGASSAAFIELAQLHLHTFDFESTLTGQYAFWHCKSLQIDSLFQSGCDLFRKCRHFIAGSAVNDADLAGTESQCGASHIYCSVSTANYCHPFFNSFSLAKSDLAKEIDATGYVFPIFSGYPQFNTFVRPYSEKYRFKSFFEQLFDISFASHRAVQLDVDTVVQYVAYIPFNYIDRQPKGRDAKPHHAPHNELFLKDCC
ncbi:hypothetical protein ES703_99022 [subsurface metagenome]